MPNVDKLKHDNLFLVELASRDGKLFLTRTKGSLSAGTRVKLVSIEQKAAPDMYLVQASVIVQVRTAPGWKRERHPVWVTASDLVIRRNRYHPTDGSKNRRQRRAQAKLDQLKREV